MTRSATTLLMSEIQEPCPQFTHFCIPEKDEYQFFQAWTMFIVMSVFIPKEYSERITKCIHRLENDSVVSLPDPMIENKTIE